MDLEFLNQPFQNLDYHWGEGHWSVVAERGGLWLLGQRDDGGDLEAARYLAELERRVEDGEDRVQLASTVFQGGGRKTVRASSLPAVLLPEQPPDFALIYDKGWRKRSVAGWRSCDACGVQADKTGEEAVQLVG